MHRSLATRVSKAGADGDILILRANNSYGTPKMLHDDHRYGILFHGYDRL